MLTCESASRLTVEELERIQQILDAYPIEVAEIKASAKQLHFQQIFMGRQDDAGRRCGTFVALGGNRSGKSIVAGWLCFAKYLRDVARGGDWFWCVGQTLDRSIGGQQKELWNALPRWMFSACGAAQSQHGWQTQAQQWGEKIGFGMHRKIVLPTSDGGKCLVEFRSCDQNPSTFEQAKLTGVWCDERLPEEIYDRLLARIIDRDGFILYSDIPEQWWQFERLMEAKPAAGVHFQHFEMLDNEHNLPPGAITRASASMTEDEKKKRIAGLFVVLEGVVYRQYTDLRHSIKPFKIPARWPKWRIIDYGSSAPTACLWVAIGDTERAYVYREYYQANLSIEENAKAIVAMSGDEKYVQTFMDPHAIDTPPVIYGIAKTVSQQYADAGISSTGWPYVQVMGEHAMVERVKQRLEHEMLAVFEACINTRREFRSWKYKCDKEGKPLAADAYENANNHTLDCLKGFFGTNPTFAQTMVRILGG